MKNKRKQTRNRILSEANKEEQRNIARQNHIAYLKTWPLIRPQDIK